MSLSLKLFKWFLRTSNVKKRYDRPIEEINQMKAKLNRRMNLEIKPGKGWTSGMVMIQNREVLIIHPETGKTKRALLYLHGGGFSTDISDIEKKMAVKFGRRSGRDVWVPRYPTIMDVSVREIYVMLRETYREMLKYYSPENIAVIGFSAGATAALAMFEYNNTLAERLPVPELMIVSSPACEPVTEEEKRLIQEKADKDMMIPASFVDTMFPAMRHGEDLPGYMTEITTGDLSGFPYTHIYYTDDEVLSASAETLVNAFHRCNAECELHIGKGLFHCYAGIDLFPETRAAFDEIVGYLS